TADCLADDARAWIGSLSGSDWGGLAGAPPERLDESILTGADDGAYLTALEMLLARMPAPALTFVIAGGDVLGGDRLGRLNLTLAGAFARDVAVARALAGRAS